MAIITGMKCINCEAKDARKGSHFCSKKCADAHCKNTQGPVVCVNRYVHGCFSEADTVSEARRLKWTKIEADPEGFAANFEGLCPECKREGLKPEH